MRDKEMINKEIQKTLVQKTHLQHWQDCLTSLILMDKEYVETMKAACEWVLNLQPAGGEE